VQACPAVLVHIETSISPEQAYLGSSVTVYAHVYATDYPGVKMANVPVRVRVSKPSLASVYVNGTTNASGWAAIPYTPDETGNYGTTGFATVDFSTIPGLPPAGVQNYPVSPPLIVLMNDLNVTAAPPRFIPRTVSPAGLVPVGVTTAAPLPPATTQAPEATPTPPVLPDEPAAPETPVVPSATTLPPETGAPSGVPVPAGQETVHPATTLPVTAAADTLPVTGTPARQAAPLLQPVPALAAAFIVVSGRILHQNMHKGE
jgi:hypothetical protein